MIHIQLTDSSSEAAACPSSEHCLAEVRVLFHTGLEVGLMHMLLMEHGFHMIAAFLGKRSVKLLARLNGTRLSYMRHVSLVANWSFAFPEVVTRTSGFRLAVERKQGYEGKNG